MRWRGPCGARCTGRTAGGSCVVCGKGNNGGDGLVARARARELGRAHERCSSSASRLDRRRCARALTDADVVVDAMYGTGFRGTLDGDAAWWSTQLGRFDGEVVAVDIPSGVDGLHRRGLRAARAGRRARSRFAARKPGLVFEPGRSLAGRGRSSPTSASPSTTRRTRRDSAWSTTHRRRARGFRPRAPDAHKWQSGALVVGGSAGMTGAPLLVSHAAMRAGAGIVWCALPGRRRRAPRVGERGDHQGRCPPTRPASLATVPRTTLLADVGRFARAGDRARPRRRRRSRCSSWCARIVAEARPPLVLDADGLNALAGDFTSLHARRTLGAPTVLTPHAGEYERLMGAPVGRRPAGRGPGAGRRGRARWCCSRARARSSPTPTARVALNPTGGPGLATAGTGDVLTGIIAGFLARGVAPFHAAAAAAWVHGRAADRLVETDGPGLVAGDLVAGLGRTLQELGVQP